MAIRAKGDGAMGEELNPKPSNLADADWKHGSTDGEIFTVIRDGVKSTGMKAFSRKTDHPPALGRRELRPEHRTQDRIPLKIVVADDLPASALELLRAEAGWVVDARSGRTPDALAADLADADAHPGPQRHQGDARR